MHKGDVARPVFVMLEQKELTMRLLLVVPLYCWLGWVGRGLISWGGRISVDEVVGVA